KSIEALCKDKDWGSPYFYDIKIHKTGEKTDTEYNVNPVPHKVLDQYVISCFKNRPCNLNALFTNEDPFATHWDSYVELAIESISKINIDEKKTSIPFKDLLELKKTFSECDPKYQKELIHTLSKMTPSINGLDDIPIGLYEKIKQAINKNKNEYEETLKYSDELFSRK
ncbi:MAG: hypothetical protein AABY22_10480, partial [Nanoarchaeota archaeon]